MEHAVTVGAERRKIFDGGFESKGFASDRVGADTDTVVDFDDGAGEFEFERRGPVASGAVEAAVG